MTDISHILGISPVIPVVTFTPGEDAVAIARALLEGGVGIIEVTLRTQEGFSAIEVINREVPEMCTGAGTVWGASDALAAINGGANFIVSPGRTDEVHRVCQRQNVPYLPGIQTISEAAYWVGKGLTAVKFFPAEVAGGVAALKAFSSVFPDLMFCPTGGVSIQSAPRYLAMPCVPCVGGSWLVDGDAVKHRDWKKIRTLASQASLLGSTG